MSLLVDNYHNLELFPKFCKRIKKYSTYYVSNCLRYHANELAKEIRTEEDNFAVLTLLRNSYFLGDFWSFYDICEILDKNNYYQAKLIFQISQKIYNNRHNIGEILLENSKINIYATCLRKGIGTEKSLAKAKEIYEKYAKDNDSKLLEYSYLKGLMEYGKTLRLCGEKDSSFKIYKKFFDSAKNEDNISINRQFTLLFNIAKCLEKGFGCDRDIKEALLLYELAVNTKKYCFFFEMKIMKTIQKHISKINKELLDVGVVDIRTCTLCALCKIKTREIFYTVCKHFHICEDCQNQRNDKKKECAFCQKPGPSVKLYL